MTEVVVIDADSQADLQSFSQYLWEQGVSHRILENQGRQLLLVGDPTTALAVKEAYQCSLNGLELPVFKARQQAQAGSIAMVYFKLLPVTLTAIILSLIGFLLVYFDRNLEWVRLLTFFDFQPMGRYAQLSQPDGQYWRLITPIFLHFGLMHIAFNMTLLWFVGIRIEKLQGSFKMLGIVMVIGLSSNMMQAYLAEAGIFGGMSGVVYGLIGYGWIWNMMRPNRSLNIPNALVYFSIVMMVTGFAGIDGLFGAGKVANLAHLGGLVTGFVLGLAAALMDKYSALPRE